MKGDFSRWRRQVDPNVDGVLQQQGRPLLDVDWNDQTRIVTDWQDRAARQIIGAGVAAVPAGTPDALKVVGARVVGGAGGRVELDVSPGQGWADGIAVRLGEGDGAVEQRDARYLGPPIQDPAGEVSEIADGVRDAVVLEVWREALNGFQTPAELLDPALGGVDTTERVRTAMRFRLYRLAEGETCRDIRDDLVDDPAALGRLRATLKPSEVLAGDCPVEEGGGYLGFEHFLYRIEIARIDAGDVMFKWSRFNGGLVGRGECDLTNGPDDRITIKANDQAIELAGRNDFYLEVVEFDAAAGHWRVTYGADATLNGDDLEIVTVRYQEATLPSGRVFFRLWDGIEPITDFGKVADPADAEELRDGIRLEFDADTGANYRPGDYWTFPVRAGGVENADPLIDDEPPEGIRYHRVPLAILEWNAARDIAFDDDEIRDCRDVFRPLTDREGCCSFTVGDGETSFGDFNSIEEALEHLPASGGQLCLLPGTHRGGVLIEERTEVTIKGCDRRTRVLPAEDDDTAPIFHVRDSAHVVLEHMDLVTVSGSAVVAESSQPGATHHLVIRHNRVLAYDDAIVVVDAVDVEVERNIIRVLDKEGAGVGIAVLAEDARIERNDIGVVPAEEEPPEPDDGTPDDIDPEDPCAKPGTFYAQPATVAWYGEYVWTYMVAVPPENPYEALGGIRIDSGSDGVRVRDNRVHGGAGNGITLGSPLDLEKWFGQPGDGGQTDTLRAGGFIQGIVQDTETNEAVDGATVHFRRASDGSVSTTVTDGGGAFTMSLPSQSEDYEVSVAEHDVLEVERFAVVGRGTIVIVHVTPVEEQPDAELPAAFVYDVDIEENAIRQMGLSGIGAPTLHGIDVGSIAVRGFEKGGFAALGMLRAVNQTRLAVSAQKTPLVLLALLGPIVIGLRIFRNHIHECVQAPFDDELRLQTRLRGLGGISLGVCEDLIIEENRIEANGTSHIDPVCGVFVFFGEQIEISHNRIDENGPIVVEHGLELEEGMRGGVVVPLAAAFGLRDLEAGGRTSLPKGNAAIRMIGNHVDQPAGQALLLGAFGPAAVTDNYFNSELTGPEPMHLMAGTVLIVNHGVGQSLSLNPWFGQAAGDGMMVVDGSEEAAAEMARSPQNMEKTYYQTAGFTLFRIGGNTLFDDNQTRRGPANRSRFCQMIVSNDDVGFADNQADDLSAEVVPEGIAIKGVGTRSGNTYVQGATVRATGSRFEETRQPDADQPLLSLFTTARYLNTTALNQADHCIMATVDTGGQLQNAGNLILTLSDLCAQVVGQFEKYAKQYAENIYYREVKQ